MPEPAQDPNAQNPEAANPAKPAEPAGQSAPAAGAGQPAAQPDLTQVISAAVQAAIQPLAAKVEALSSSAPQPGSAPAPVDDLDSEIKLRQEQLGAIDRGELDASYRPAVQTALSSAIARKEGRAIVEREGIRGGFVQSYNQHLATAYQEFPELKDANSELHKETLAILNQSPAYKRAQQALNSRGRDAEKVDWATLDSRVALTAAREAHSIVTRRNAGKPLSQQQPNPKAAASALETGSGTPVVGDDELSRLEQRAIESGSQSDWRQFIKARDQKLRQAKQMA